MQLLVASDSDPQLLQIIIPMPAYSVVCDGVSMYMYVCMYVRS